MTIASSTTIEAPTMIVPMALISGVMPRRITDQIYIGRVLSRPVRKKVTGISSNDRVNEISDEPISQSQIEIAQAAVGNHKVVFEVLTGNRQGLRPLQETAKALPSHWAQSAFDLCDILQTGDGRISERIFISGAHLYLESAQDERWIIAPARSGQLKFLRRTVAMVDQERLDLSP